MGIGKDPKETEAETVGDGDEKSALKSIHGHERTTLRPKAASLFRGVDVEAAMVLRRQFREGRKEGGSRARKVRIEEAL